MEKTASPQDALRKRKLRTWQKNHTGNGAKRRETSTLDAWIKRTPSSNNKDKIIDMTIDSESSLSSGEPQYYDKELIKNDIETKQLKTNFFQAKSYKKSTQKTMFGRKIIHLSDRCRVCNEAQNGDLKRCDLRCQRCSMTIHKSCYLLKKNEIDEINDDWICNRCAYITKYLEEKNADENAENVSPTVTSNSSRNEYSYLLDTEVQFPTAKQLSPEHNFAVLYENFEFAIVFCFLKRFRRFGLGLQESVSLNRLLLELIAPEDESYMAKLHSLLLSKIAGPIPKSSHWTYQLLQVLESSDSTPAQQLFDTLGISTDVSNIDSIIATNNEKIKTEERTKEPYDPFFYEKLPVTQRVMILKILCELQFDHNEDLANLIVDANTEDLREEPIGCDAMKRSYYILEDDSNVEDGTMWLCRNNSSDGSHWETMCDNLESFESFLYVLSLSDNTEELQLRTVLQKYERRLRRWTNKRNSRLRHGNRWTSAKVDESLIINATRRSTRNRNVINYVGDNATDNEEFDWSNNESNDNDEDTDDMKERHEPVRGTRSSLRLRDH